MSFLMVRLCHRHPEGIHGYIGHISAITEFHFEEQFTEGQILSILRKSLRFAASSDCNALSELNNYLISSLDREIDQR